MGDEKNITPPTSPDSTKPQYNLATNNKSRSSTTSERPLFESSEVGTGYKDSVSKVPSKKKED